MSKSSNVGAEQNMPAVVPNKAFWYQGHHIVKLWEKYLTSKNDSISFLSARDGEVAGEDNVSSLFNGMSLNYNFAIVLQGNNLYRNSSDQTITLCGEVADRDVASITRRMEAIIEQIRSYNQSHPEAAITNHIIIFPYHRNPGHWNLGTVELTFTSNDDNDEQINARISIYEPFGGVSTGYDHLASSLSDLNIVFEQNKLSATKQQYNGTSCGAITAENAKLFLAQSLDDQSGDLLERTYKAGAEELRRQHIAEIDDKAFNQTQRDNQAYAVGGDRSIEEAHTATQSLADLIAHADRDWVKQAIRHLLNSEDDNIRRDNIDLFKQFLLQQQYNEDDQYSKIAGMLLEADGRFKEGAMDVIAAVVFREDNSQFPTFSATNSSARHETTVTLELSSDYDNLDTEAKVILDSVKKVSLDDLIIQGTYSFVPSKPTARALFKNTDTEETIIFGASDNLLFYIASLENGFEVIPRIAFGIRKVLDSHGNNILHHAVFRQDLNLVTAILHRAMLDGIISDLVNHRNHDGTNPLGMAFLSTDSNNLGGIKIATIFAGIFAYDITGYLNNKVHMDYTTSTTIGGTTLLHNVMLAASKCKGQEFRKALSEFFKVLSKRMHDDKDCFNPNYPTMNPGSLGELENGKKLDSKKLDGHMISSSKLLELKFKSQGIKLLCKKYFDFILASYEVDQFDDDSGDSADEDSPAYTYKQMLLDFNRFIGNSIKGHTREKSHANFQRTFDAYDSDFAFFSDAMEGLSITEDDPWNNFWLKLNSISADSTESAEYKEVIDSMYVPLFHGVPFMHSQYSNFQRREVAKKIFAINRKLLGRFDDSMTEVEYTLTPEEEILIGIHSRTATASAGMQSLYEIMVASPEDLQRLNTIDENLWGYFNRHDLPKKFKIAMKDYVFNFASSPIRGFWENNNNDGAPHSDSELPPSDDEIVKYRFPVIATSKAPDHAIRFAIGRNVEAARGEIRMQPEYIDGFPTHRLAGLLYVTMHKLSDLLEARGNHTMIDVNRRVKSGDIDIPTENIEKDPDFLRFKNQLECDFLGKISSDTVVAVIPVIYPNIHDGDGFESGYHEAVFGLNSSATRIYVTSPVKIRGDLSNQPNPKIMSGSSNIVGFGKVIIPTMVALANGILTAIAEKYGYFLCAIRDDNELVPYKVKFDERKKKGAGQLSEAQLDIKNSGDIPQAIRLWQSIADQTEEDSDVAEIGSMLSNAHID
ncbi:MAG: hypothetical protein COA94_02595 [Rickettsiales bacterium]|nr:MAG: hypothetical protein COA94_02595 [Rickettsiales bacterium]